MNQPNSFFEKLAISIIGNTSRPLRIERVVIDSRKQVKNGLFIPIKGERYDGHDFLLQAIENGAVACYWQKDQHIPDGIPDDFPFFFVEDTLSALQKLAKQYLIYVNPKVVAITGSNGKTTTKDMLASITKELFLTHKTHGNYNNHIGMPLTILEMEPDCEVLILEMGMSGFGEISFLSKLAEPDYAVITNIGDSHVEQLGSRKGIAQAKLEILHGLKRESILLIDGDEPLFNHIKTNNIVTCGYDSHNKVQIGEITGNEDGQFFTLKGETARFYLPLLGKHNIKNACFAIVLARRLGMKDLTIQNGLKHVQLTGMRLERLKGKNHSLIINDAYNASPTSMKAAIKSLEMLTDYPRKVVILGDMYELGEDEESLHRGVADYIGDDISHVITVGDKGKWVGKALRERNWKGSVSICATKKEATSLAESLLSPKTVILFKASRGMKLETMVEQLICR